MLTFLEHNSVGAGPYKGKSSYEFHNNNALCLADVSFIMFIFSFKLFWYFILSLFWIKSQPSLVYKNTSIIVLQSSKFEEITCPHEFIFIILTLSRMYYQKWGWPYRKNLYDPFWSMGSTASRLQSNYEEEIYFLPPSPQTFLVLN